MTILFLLISTKRFIFVTVSLSDLCSRLKSKIICVGSRKYLNRFSSFVYKKNFVKYAYCKYNSFFPCIHVVLGTNMYVSKSYGKKNGVMAILILISVVFQTDLEDIMGMGMEKRWMGGGDIILFVDKYKTFCRGKKICYSDCDLFIACRLTTQFVFINVLFFGM